MYLDSKKKIEELGIRLIDPDTYDFKIADHVCVYIPKTPSEKFKNIPVKIPSLPLGFWHHGLCCGRDDHGIIRFISQNIKGITYDDIQTFSEGCIKWGIIDHKYEINSRSECLKNAIYCYRNRTNEYDPKNNNCEHFVNRIIEEKHESKQVNVVKDDLIELGLGVASSLFIGAAGIILARNVAKRIKKKNNSSK